jgi:AcrR family transcriptional regulator
MKQPSASQSREKVLDAAEALFMQRGYASVTLLDIAQALNIRQASLYHHVKGKEELFIEVAERTLARHRHGLQQAMAAEGQSWQDQLYAVARWLMSQEPMNVTRLIHSDLPEVSAAHRDQIVSSVYESVLRPLEQIFHQAQAEIARPLPPAGTMVGAFLSLIDGIRNVPGRFGGFDRHEMANQLIALLIRGMTVP